MGRVIVSSNKVILKTNLHAPCQPSLAKKTVEKIVDGGTIIQTPAPGPTDPFAVKFKPNKPRNNIRLVL